ncbi:MAG TPA: serine hydrolase [Blastocatellia bacterium]|nr:serine hydrolase [Blastocatellia bacterium]
MLNKRFSRYLVALSLILVHAVAPALAFRGSGPATQATPDLAPGLEAIEKALDARRAELGIPGLSLAIIKDGGPVLMKGFGFRDVERKLPVTPETLFAIGSCSKAFTAMAAVMSADEGKLSLDDSPKKYLPYFKLQDPEADAKVRVRDLLSHQSGLDGTDIAWYTGELTREEVIKVAGLAKPKAKLHEKFQYQNVMYSAAGEVVAKAQNSTWEGVIADRFFKPLGMKMSDTSVKQMAKSSDHATGYELKNRVAKKAILRDLTNIAPAGAINSNARDMAQWVRLLLNGGEFEGKRLVSEKGFQEILTKQISAGEAGLGGYTLGWGLADWKGKKVFLHTGGIDGFNSLVAFMPEKKIGFVLLTNVSGSPITGFALRTIWTNLVDAPEQQTAAAPPASSNDPQNEVGSYLLEQAGMTIEIKMVDGKLMATVPGQPDYPLVKVEGRRYRLAAPAPEGFFMTFRPTFGREDQTEMYLEQPQGNFVLPKKAPASSPDKASSEKKPASPALLDLLGKYDMGGRVVEVVAKDDKVSLVVPGQPPYTLFEKEKDRFGARELPDTYSIQAVRGADGKVHALKLRQPEGEFELKRMAASAATSPDISADELMSKVIAAYGGEANIRRHRSMVVTSDLNFIHQGITGERVTTMQAPNLSSSNVTFIGLGKKMGWVREYFDGSKGGSEASFSNPEAYEERHVNDARIDSDFYQLLNWKALFKETVVKEKSKLGDEEVYVVVKTPEKGGKVTEYVSAKSFLILKREMMRSSLGSETPAPISESFSDFRTVDGVTVPFQTVEESAGLGTVTTRVKDVKFDVKVPESAFRAGAK